MNKCYIVAAADFAEDKFSPSRDDFVIAADAGLKYLNKLGVKPNLIVGDFDSLGEVPSGNNVITLPVEKDDTDTMTAIKEGLNRGYKEFLIFGGQGRRIDHTLSNIQGLVYLSNHGARGILVGLHENICIVNSEKIAFSKEATGTMSLISLCKECTGVYLTNFYYPLSNATVTNDFPIGVSNEFTGKTAIIEVKSGICAVIFTCSIDFLNPSI